MSFIGSAKYRRLVLRSRSEETEPSKLKNEKQCRFKIYNLETIKAGNLEQHFIPYLNFRGYDECEKTILCPDIIEL